ncbi:MAG: cytochrome c oxidase assembly protein [Streptosporangiaceae bacterium]
MVISVAATAAVPALAPAPLTWQVALMTWQFAPVVSVGLAAAASGYALGLWRLLRRRGRRSWPTGRTVAFLAGLSVIAVATQSSIGVYDDELFSVHMVQHVLLLMVAPPLLVYGRPVTLALHASRNPLHTWIKRIVRSRIPLALTWPVAATLLYCVVVAGTHTPPVMDLVLENGTVHDAEHVLYLVSGYLFFLPIVGSEPIRWRMSVVSRYLVMMLAMMVDSATGIVFSFQSHEVFPPYARTGRSWGPGLVADLHAGGYIMVFGSDLVMTVIMVALAIGFVRAAKPDADGDAGLAAYNEYLGKLSAGYLGGGSE